jgi:hypothetical protein
MRTKQLSIFQYAYITYTDDSAAQQFTNNFWSAFLVNDLVRVLPLSLTDEQRDHRKEFTIKLSGLPRNTTSRDLISILTETKAKSCFIPRNPNGYWPLNYAYISFNSKDDIASAVTKEWSLKGSLLYWTTEKTPTCHICGNPDHVAKDCDDPRNRNSKRNTKIQKLYNKFRPAQHRKPRKTYAATAKNDKQTKPRPPSPVDQHAKDELIQVAGTLNKLQEDFRLIQFQISSLRKDIEQQKKGKSIPHKSPGNATFSNDFNNSAINTPVNPSAISKQNQKRPASQVVSQSSSTDTDTSFQITSDLENRQNNLEQSLLRMSSVVTNIQSSVNEINRRSSLENDGDTFDTNANADQSEGYYNVYETNQYDDNADIMQL